MHDLTLAAQYADRMLLLDGGRVVADGPPADVLTEASIASHYGAAIEVVSTSGGRIAVIPRRQPTSTAREPRAPQALPCGRARLFLAAALVGLALPVVALGAAPAKVFFEDTVPSEAARPP